MQMAEWTRNTEQVIWDKQMMVPIVHQLVGTLLRRTQPLSLESYYLRNLINAARCNWQQEVKCKVFPVFVNSCLSVFNSKEGCS